MGLAEGIAALLPTRFQRVPTTEENVPSSVCRNNAEEMPKEYRRVPNLQWT